MHAHARFVLILSGGITEIRGDDTQSHGSSTLLFRRAGEPHAYLVSRAGATCLIVDIDDGWHARARLHAPVLEQSTGFRGGFVLHLAHRLHGEFRLRDEVSRLAIESITLGVLAEASRRAAKASERPAPGWLQQARAGRYPFREAAAAGGGGATGRGASGPSRPRLPRRPSDHLCRVRAARPHRVRAPSTGGVGGALGDIAVAAGFCDQSHFSRLFKRYTGQTPAEYRLALQAR
ncbi:MAG: AraC family transcriptional regulator [Vicinamibacterales bacterium]